MKSSKCIYELIEEEVKRQLDIWGEQNHPDTPICGTGLEALFKFHFGTSAEAWKRANHSRDKDGHLAWDGILLEEVYEALAESDPEKRKTELVQAAAVIVTWLKCIERRVEEIERREDSKDET